MSSLIIVQDTKSILKGSVFRVDNYHWCLSSVILREDIFFFIGRHDCGRRVSRAERKINTNRANRATEGKWAKQVNSSIERVEGDMGNMFGACFIPFLFDFVCFMCINLCFELCEIFLFCLPPLPLAPPSKNNWKFAQRFILPWTDCRISDTC